MPSASIEIRGMREALAKLDRATGDAVIKRILEAGSLHIERVAVKYPPLSEANRAREWGSVYSIATHRKMNTWYLRGYGPKWVVKSGAVHGRQTSEQLQQNWSIRVQRYQAIVGNNASYGRYVMDEAKQARFHKGRGWRTIQDIADKERERVVQFAKAEIDKELNR